MIDQEGFASFSFWGAFFSWLAGTICVAAGVEWGTALIIILAVFVLSVIVLLSETVDSTGNRPLVALASVGGLVSFGFWISCAFLMERLPLPPSVLVPAGLVFVWCFGYLTLVGHREKRKRKEAVS